MTGATPTPTAPLQGVSREGFLAHSLPGRLAPMKKRLAIAAFVLIALLICWASLVLPARLYDEQVVITADGDPIPKDWNLNRMRTVASTVREVPAEFTAQPELKVLTWKTWKSGERVGACVVWLHWPAPGAKHQLWGLVHLDYSKPMQGGPPEWSYFHVYDAPCRAQEDYDHAPNNEEVYAFMRGAWWSFTGDDKSDDASVCVNAWKNSIGDSPTRFYPRARKKPRTRFGLLRWLLSNA
jgi:hypothetical protein